MNSMNLGLAFKRTFNRLAPSSTPASAIEQGYAEQLTPQGSGVSKASFCALYQHLFSFEDRSWDEVIANARIMRMPADMEVFNGKQPMKHFVLLLEGNVRVYQPGPEGREITLYRVAPGDVCILSLTSMLRDQTHNVIAKTESETSALCISETQFRQLMSISEKFRDFILVTLSERLSNMMCLVQDSLFKNMHVRVACQLDRLFRQNRAFRFATTHQAIAQELGTTREVISRILKEFEKENYIQISRGTIEIISYDNIHRLAHPSFC